MSVTGADLLDTFVCDVLTANPDAAWAFLVRGMACAGCPFAPFETVAEVAAVYNVDALDLAASLAGSNRAFNIEEH